MTIRPTDPSPGVSMSMGEALSPQQQVAEFWFLGILAVLVLLIATYAFWPEITAAWDRLQEPADDEFGGDPP